MGLAISEGEFQAFIEGDDLAEALNNWPQLFASLNSLRSQLSATETDRAQVELAIAEIYSIAATHHFRPRHATPDRYRELIARIRTAIPDLNPFEIRGISFEDELIDICASHNLDAAILCELRNAHEERFQRRFIVADHVANTQFIAATLRLTDILDFDFERTPRVLFDSLGLKQKSLPGSEVSLREWEKHLSVQQIEIRESEIVVKAKCKHPAIEAAVRQFCQLIEGEIRTTLSVIHRNYQEIVDKYRFRIPSNVRAEIKSDGYKFLDLSLSLDESAVMSILMGTSLYRTPYAAIRELIQNAVDACTVRHALRPDMGPGKIEIFEETDENDRRWLCVRDNGIGMNEYVLKTYFFKVGRSYYTSSDFDRLFRTAATSKPPLASRFGIGFLACFMLADLVEVETFPVPLHPNEPHSAGMRVSIERLGALAYVQDVSAKNYGTLVRLRMRSTLGSGEDIQTKIFDFVKGNVVRPPATITLALPNRTLAIEPYDYFSLVEHPRSPEGVPQAALKVIDLHIERYSDIFSGKVFLVFVDDETKATLDVRFGERLLTFDKDSKRDRLTIPPQYIFRQFGGNRITVGDFRMQFPGLGKLLRHGVTVLPVVYDIDICPGEHVTFDVARTRILDENVALRIRLKDAVRRGLEDIGVWPKLADAVKKALSLRSRLDPFRVKHEVLRQQGLLVTDENLLSKVMALLPTDSWPVAVHREVAARLGITPTHAFNAISTLIVEGRVVKPNTAP